jgi:hypothetical protein
MTYLDNLAIIVNIILYILILLLLTVDYDISLLEIVKLKNLIMKSGEIS